MDENYMEIREHLRKSHDQNTREIYQREQNPVYQYQYIGKANVREAGEQITSRTFFLKIKIFLFLTAVLTFSCYIYGGQDMEQGAKKAVSEIKTEIIKLEEQEPAVKEAMVYVRRAYQKVDHIAKDYMEQAQTDTK